MAEDRPHTPLLLLCGFTSFPGALRNPAGEIVAAMAAEGWRPAGVRLEAMTVPVLWRGAGEAVLAAAKETGADGILVVGVAAGAAEFRVETLGRNLACAVSPDAKGDRWGRGEICPGGPAEIAATAPVGEMVAALRREGLPVSSSDDAGDYLCNFTLYRLLKEAVAPRVGFLHIPQAVEFSADGAMPLDQLTRGVRIAVAAFAREAGFASGGDAVDAFDLRLEGGGDSVGAL